MICAIAFKGSISRIPKAVRSCSQISFSEVFIFPSVLGFAADGWAG
jgi:hypothetical protein